MREIIKKAGLILILFMLLTSSAFALGPDEMLDDPALESRARDISRLLRCPVCQGEAIDESNAALAKDLRVLVRERLLAGDSNDAAIDYIHARYGDYVLLKPPVRPATYFLWLAPVLIVCGGIWIALRQSLKKGDGA